MCSAIYKNFYLAEIKRHMDSIYQIVLDYAYRKENSNREDDVYEIYEMIDMLEKKLNDDSLQWSEILKQWV